MKQFAIATISAVSLLSCSSSTSNDNGTTAENVAAEDAPAATPAGGVDCASMSEGNCLLSEECILEDIEDSYEYTCRPARGSCEQGFVQWRPIPDDPTGDDDVLQQDCQAREGCAFEPPSCYCFDEDTEVVVDGQSYGGLVCRCSGGPPARCHRAEAQ